MSYIDKCTAVFDIYVDDLGLNGWRALFCITNNRHGVTITTHEIERDFLIWMTTVRQPMKRRCSCILILKYAFFVFIGERDKESTTPWLW